MDTNTSTVVGQRVWSDYDLQWVKAGQQFERTDPITDTSKLVVGQNVWLSAMDQGFIEGKVVEVTPEGVDVQATGQGIIHFNREGYLPLRTIRDLPFWRIDSLPFAERKDMLERGRQNKLVVGQKVWMQSGDEFQEGTVEEVAEYYGQKARMRCGNLFIEGTVTEIIEKHIEVTPVFLDQNERPWMIRFDKNGKLPPRDSGTGEWIGFGYHQWYEAFGGWWQEYPDFDPWELTDSRN